jgi:hypothetical protein
MGKKPQRHNWPEAKKLCRLNQNDIEMAKRLGFGPDVLIRARPDPKQKWKLPVKYWVRDLHQAKFGHVIGEKLPVPTPELAELEYDEEAARLYGEQLYGEDYHERNRDDQPNKRGGSKPVAAIRPTGAVSELASSDEDVPF